MLSDSARKFDLYDFFSVLLPGAALLVALLPFLPNKTNLDTLGVAIPLLLGGFIVGRAVHSVAAELEDEWETIPTHRERFAQEINDPSYLNKNIVCQFYNRCAKEFDLIDSDKEWERGELDETTLKSLYVLIRSYIHMDSRGRSRSFQAIYAFHRSMWVVAFFVGTTYYVYGTAKSLGLLNGVVNWMSYFGSLHFPPFLIGFSAAAIALIGHRIFSLARDNYKKYYIQYLVADFLVLQGLDYPEAVVVADQWDEDG